MYYHFHKQHRMHSIKSIETPLVCGVPECTTIFTNNSGYTLLNQLELHWFVVFLNVLPFPQTTLDALEITQIGSTFYILHFLSIASVSCVACVNRYPFTVPYTIKSDWVPLI